MSAPLSAADLLEIRKRFLLSLPYGLWPDADRLVAEIDRQAKEIARLNSRIEQLNIASGAMIAETRTVTRERNEARREVAHLTSCAGFAIGQGDDRICCGIKGCAKPDNHDGFCEIGAAP
ncbi:MAG TPA: hypothetical protein VIM73_23220 [Polyangiaceae bacterium]